MTKRVMRDVVVHGPFDDIAISFMRAPSLIIWRIGGLKPSSIILGTLVIGMASLLCAGAELGSVSSAWSRSCSLGPFALSRRKPHLAMLLRRAILECVAQSYEAAGGCGGPFGFLGPRNELPPAAELHSISSRSWFFWIEHTSAIQHCLDL